MILSAIVEIVLGCFLLFGRNIYRKALSLLWFASNLIMYRLGSAWLGVHTCPCLGTLGAKLPLPVGMPEKMLQWLVTAWFCGSTYMLFYSRSGYCDAEMGAALPAKPSEV
jgi:hypothetical protein